jgi:hypothetical protein
MNRRDVIKGLAGTGLFVAVAPAVSGTPVNTFGPDDTLEVRLRKFNQLTGLRLTFSKVNRKGERSFMYPDGHSTGSMDEETMMHWTAQVGLGWRLAKGGK